MSLLPPCLGDKRPCGVIPPVRVGKTDFTESLDVGCDARIGNPVFAVARFEGFEHFFSMVAKNGRLEVDGPGLQIFRISIDINQGSEVFTVAILDVISVG